MTSPMCDPLGDKYLTHINYTSHVKLDIGETKAECGFKLALPRPRGLRGSSHLSREEVLLKYWNKTMWHVVE